MVEPGINPPTIQELWSGASGTAQTTGSQAGSSPDHNPLLEQVRELSPYFYWKIYNEKCINYIDRELQSSD